jgi:hypothetical protein
MTKYICVFAIAGFLSLPALAATESFSNVPVVDVKCSTKVADAPDAHTRQCALACAASGFGILTQNKQFLKFDQEGNSKIVEALKASDKKDNLRVNVSGDVEGDTLKVTSIKLL